jgi:Tfp pilus assembly PilM family ATPase/Tfp pilus assembly protein PilN
MMLTSLNISSKDVKYLVARGTNVTDWGSLPLPDALHNGVIRHPETVGARIKELFAAKKLPRDKVICSLNGLPFTYRFAPLPKMSRPALNEAVMRVARREIPLSPDDMYLSWQAYQDGREEWECLMMGVARHPVDSLIQTLATAGIRPYVLDIKHLLLAGLTGRSDAIIVDFESDFSAITIIADGIPAAMHTVPSLGPGAQPHEEVERLVDELNKMVGFYNNSHPQKNLPETAVVLLTGETTADPAVAESIQNETDYRVEGLDPPLDIPPGLPVDEYAANIGAVLKITAPESKAGTITPPFHHINLGRIVQERKAGLKPADFIKMLLLPVALLAAAGLLVAAAQFQKQSAAEVAEKQAELSLANQALAQSMARLEQAGQAENEIIKLAASTEALRQKNEAILTSEEYVSDLSRLTDAMPSGMSFTSLDMPGGQITVKGIIDNPARVVQFTRDLEAAGAFPQADIMWIKKATDTGISFMVVISK